MSILIANYNNGCYIQETIDSIEAQTYRNWEVVIVDDKSTDNSADVYAKYKDDTRFHIFYNDENKGVGFTKRRCVDMASGALCGFMDPDDVLVGTDAFEIMVQAHLDNPDASMVYSGMYRADEHLNIIKESPGKAIESGSSALQTRSWPIHPFLTFKKEMYDSTEGIDEIMRNAEDYDLYYKLEEVGDIVHLDKLLYIQRNNPHSISLNDNAYKASAWHTYACVKAMKRRGLTDETLMLFPIENAARNSYVKGYEKATSSLIYKTGLVIASPLLLIRKLWKK